MPAAKFKTMIEEDDNLLIENKIGQLKNDLEEAKEQKFVNLMIEIIVSLTLKQLHEESD